MSEIHAINMESRVGPCVRATLPVSISLRVHLCLSPLFVWVSLCFTAGMECFFFVETYPFLMLFALLMGLGRSRLPRQGKQGLPWPGTVCGWSAAFLLKQLDSIPQKGFGPVNKWHQCRLLIEVHDTFEVLRQQIHIHAKHYCYKFCTWLHGYTRHVCLRHVLFYMGNHTDTRLRATCSTK